jgi:hypothetical protein
MTTPHTDRDRRFIRPARGETEHAYAAAVAEALADEIDFCWQAADGWSPVPAVGQDGALPATTRPRRG